MNGSPVLALGVADPPHCLPSSLARRGHLQGASAGLVRQLAHAPPGARRLKTAGNGGDGSLWESGASVEARPGARADAGSMSARALAKSRFAGGVAARVPRMQGDGAYNGGAASG